MRYRAEIDGLRALAVLPVIFFHAGLEIFSGGFVGVDVFFVISGYLITTILIENIEKKRFGIVDFYERRARRILPALFFVMVACIPFAWMWMIPSEMKDFSQSLVAVSFFASNFLFWQEDGYFDADAENKPLLHTWSLAVEEQYYLLFPIFIVLAWRFGKQRVFWGICALTFMSFILSEWGWKNQPKANFYLAPSRAWELFAGSIAAFFVQKRGIKENNILSIFGLLLIIFPIYFYNENTPFPGMYSLPPVIGVMLLVLFGGERTLAAKFLSNKILVGIGLISFSAYLWHQPIFAFARIKSSSAPSINLMILLSLLSIILAIISWKFVEQPFRNRAFISKKSVFVFSFSGLLFFMIFGLFGHKSDGFPMVRFPEAAPLESIYPKSEKIIAQSVRSDKNRSCSSVNLKPLSEEVCVTNSSEPRVLVVGDSKAMALYSGLHSELLDIPALLIAAHSCPMFPNLTYTPTYKQTWDNNCTEIARKILSIPSTITSIDTVIVVNRSLEINDTASRYFHENSKVTNREAFRLGYSEFLNKLAKQVESLIFVTDVPTLESDPLRCHYISVDSKKIGSGHCNVSKSDVREARSSYYSELSRLESTHDFVVFDSVEVLCENDKCPVFSNGRMLYFDKTHLTPRGSYTIIKEMLRRELF